MQGLPGSGKTTLAMEIVQKEGNVVRIGRDQLRDMLHFGKWTGRNEDVTRKVQTAVAKSIVEQGLNVLVDDTNIQDGRIAFWKQFAKDNSLEIRWVRMDATLEECIERDASRDKPVGRDVIVAMALQAGLYPKPQKGFVLCDIDGTLADIKHRLHFVQQEKKDWKGFFSHMMSDTPRVEVVDMLLNYEQEGYEIVFVSARPDDYRAFTEDWIENKAFNGYRIHKTLLMRRAGDKRPDTEVKQGIYDMYFKGKYPILTVIDDRPVVIEMWRANGLQVIDVGDGVHF